MGDGGVMGGGGKLEASLSTYGRCTLQCADDGLSLDPVMCGIHEMVCFCVSEDTTHHIIVLLSVIDVCLIIRCATIPVTPLYYDLQWPLSAPFGLPFVPLLCVHAYLCVSPHCA